MAKFSFEAPRDRSDRRRLLYATILVIALFLADMLSGGALRALAQRTMASAWTLSGAVRSAVFDSGYFRTHRSLAKENASLREQLAREVERAAGAKAIQEENHILRSLLSMTDTDTGITAPVVSSVRASPYGTFLVGAGQKDAVTVGALVVTEGGFVVGQVTEVRESTSLVTEVFAGGVRVDAAIGGAIAPAEGRGGGNARISIPRAIEVIAGDVVTAPQLGNRPIGLVGKVESDTSSADQTVYVHLPINLASLRFIYIVQTP